MFARLILVSLMLAAWNCFGDIANQIENGEFNEPKVSEVQTYFAPNSDIVGWELIAGSVDLIPAETWEYSPQLLDLTGESPGVIQQNISTEPGGIYRVRCRYVNHPGTSEPVSARLEILSSTTTHVDQWIEYSGWTGQNPNESGFFAAELTAESDQLTIRLSAESDDDGYGLIIRSVYIRRFLIGDMNCDERVNLLDIVDFVNCVTNCSYNETADINQDNSVDLLDVPPFIVLLTNSN